MTSWDKIMMLPVQSPPTPEFSSADLEWCMVESWNGVEKVAFIPLYRLDNFLSGESANKNFPTNFFQEATNLSNTNNRELSYEEAVIESAMYRCAFGLNEGEYIHHHPSSDISGLPSKKRGCQCYFIVKRLFARPSDALIIYKQDKHVDKRGLLCHGPEDARAN